MSTDKALDLALEALEYIENNYMSLPKSGTKAITAIKQARSAQAQEPVAHSVVAGVLFDFMGWLTSREKRLTLSSTDEAGPAVEAITEFAKMRGLSLHDAQVEHWQAILTTPPGGRQSEDCLTAAQEDIQRLSALVRAQQITIDKLEQARSAPVQKYLGVKPCWYESKEEKMCPKCGQVHAGAIFSAAQRQWVGLSDDEIIQCTPTWGGTVEDVARAIEAKLKEKNT